MSQSQTTANTLAATLDRRTRDRGHHPLLTVYDDLVDARTELSYATADNWASKTANLLVEELALQPGDTVALDVAGHWTAAVITLACWKAGLAVRRSRRTCGAAMCRACARFLRDPCSPLATGCVPSHVHPWRRGPASCCSARRSTCSPTTTTTRTSTPHRPRW
jgi:hypothetical protein